MKRILTVNVTTLLLFGLAAVSLGAKPAPPPPPPPAYELRMLENEFVPGGFSSCNGLNNLGDVIGIAQTSDTPLPNGNFPRQHFVSTPEGRAAGQDMVDLQALLVAAGYSQYPLGEGYILNSVVSINDSREIAAMAGLYANNTLIEYRPIVMQLAVAADGTTTIAALDDLESSQAPDFHPTGLVAMNNNGDVLAGFSGNIDNGVRIAMHTAENGWTDLGTIDPGVNVRPTGLSDRDAEGTLFIVGHQESYRG